MKTPRRVPLSLAAAFALIAGGVRLATGGPEGWVLMALGSVLLGAWLHEQAHSHPPDLEEEPQ